MLEIDISGSNREFDGGDLQKIKLKSQNTVQFNFSKFLFRSQYACEKCSEILKSFEREISKIEDEFKIKEEIIKEFFEIIQEDKVFIPIEHYKDIYKLSKHFCIPKLTNLLDNMMEQLFAKDLNFSIQNLLDNESIEEKMKKKEKLQVKSKNFCNYE